MAGSVFHITNGESTVDVLRLAGLPGEFLPWNDVLHEGPVPADISFNQLRAVRARFVADCGWRSPDDAQREFAERDKALHRALARDEIVLWFEHDLYDQLQLVQLLDWFGTCELGATRLSLVCGDEYLGASTPARLAERYPDRVVVTDDALDTARAAWRAFRSADPRDIEAFVARASPALPFLAAALVRHLEQFPSTRNGLARTQQQALEVLAGGDARLGRVFVASHHDRESPVFLGDSAFALHLAQVSAVREPLVVFADGGAGRITAPVGRAAWDTPVTLTPAGRAVLAGEADHIALNGIDRWLGGVHLLGNAAAFRWDVSSRRVIAQV